MKTTLPTKLGERLPAIDQGRPADEVAFANRFDPMRLATRAMVIVAVLFGGFGTWAAVAPLDSGIVASGTVIVDGRRRLVQHQEGGVIERLLVGEGDRCRAGPDPASPRRNQGRRRVRHSSRRL